MKFNRILTFPLFLASVLSVSCSKSEVETGIDPNLPKPTEFVLSPEGTSDNKIELIWNAKAALDAGATGFTVQIPTGISNGDNYDNTQSRTLLTSSSTFDAATFDNLKLYERRYMRVRANYKRSKYSDWVYITLNNEPVAYEIGQGFVDPALPSVDTVGYNYTESGTTSMVVNYDASTASSKNADNVTVLLQNRKSTGKNHSATVLVSENKVSFEGLTKGERYTLKARAQYGTYLDFPLLSEWTTAAEGNKSVYVVGYGAQEELPPTVKARETTSSTIIFTWSNFDFKDVNSDLEQTYRIALYKDEACSDMIVAWTLKGTETDVVSSKYQVFNKKQPCFIFSGLSSGTKYYCKVTNIETGLTSEVAMGETTPFNVVEVSSSKANVGDIVLAEDFSQMTIGGDMINEAPGFSSPNRSSFTNIEIPTGEQPDKVYGPVYSGNEVGFYNTVAGTVSKTRLDKWGVVNEGSSNGMINERPGYIKLGASSLIGLITTPALTSLSAPATLEVSFKAARYSTDPTTAGIFKVSNSSISESHVISGESSLAQAFNVPDKSNTWQEYKFTLKDVTPGTRIAIGNVRGGSGQHRMFIDDIVIQLVEYSGEAVTVPVPQNLVLTPQATSIEASWTAVQNADRYVVEYKKDAETSWTSMQPSNSTTATIENLDPETKYDVRVKAGIMGYESDYATAQATTLSAAALSPTIANAQQLVKWLKDASSASTGTSKLTADIDMSGLTISSAEDFAGVLDGQGHKIKNLRSDVPLFEKNSGTIKNLVIDASCRFTPSSNIFGVFAKENSGRIEACTNNASVSYSSNSNIENLTLIAGIAGKSSGAIVGSHNNGNITVSSPQGVNAVAAAGIAGYLTSEISGCENTGTVSFSSSHVLDGTPVTELFPGSTLSKPIFPTAGGLVGYAYTGSSFSNCTNRGEVDFTLSKIENTIFSKSVDRLNVGGIVGSSGGDITSCKNYGTVNVKTLSSDGSATTKGHISCVGGISGGDWYAPEQNASNITSCTNSGTITFETSSASGNSAVGGIVGWPGTESISLSVVTENCNNTGEVVIKGSGLTRAGGIQGGSGNIVNSHNTGNIHVISSNAKSVAGGVCGFHSQDHRITNSSAICSVISDIAIGGVAGLIGNNGNVANETGEGCKVNCTLRNGDGGGIAMVVGIFNGTTKNITIGTADSPVKVKGSVNGTAISAENLSQYLGGTNYKAGTHTINAVFGE